MRVSALYRWRCRRGMVFHGFGDIPCRELGSIAFVSPHVHYEEIAVGVLLPHGGLLPQDKADHVHVAECAHRHLAGAEAGRPVGGRPFFSRDRVSRRFWPPLLEVVGQQLPQSCLVLVLSGSAHLPLQVGVQRDQARTGDDVAARRLRRGAYRQQHNYAKESAQGECLLSFSLGECGRIRTCDPCLKRALLYQLSYAPTALQIYHSVNELVGHGRRCRAPVVGGGGSSGGGWRFLIIGEPGKPNTAIQCEQLRREPPTRVRGVPSVVCWL